MADERLAQARALIKAKQYQQARRTLTGVDHPTARAWLMKLDEIAPEVPEDDPFAVFDAPAARPAITPLPKHKSKLPWAAISIVFALIILGGAIVYAASVLLKPADVPLPEMFIKYGVTVRYPAGWVLKDDGKYGVMFSSSPLEKTMPEHLIMLFASRSGKTLDQVTVKDCASDYNEKGMVDKDGRVIIKPGGAVEPKTPITVAGFSAVKCGYRSENTMAQVVYVAIGKGDMVTLGGLSSNAAAYEPIFKSMLNSLKVDPSQLGDFGKLGLDWTPTPTPYRDLATQRPHPTDAPTPTSTAIG